MIQAQKYKIWLKLHLKRQKELRTSIIGRILFFNFENSKNLPQEVKKSLLG
jgi:hypothetical protein